MQLIKKFGTRKGKKDYISSWGLFLCPYCKKEVERQLSAGRIAQSCGCMRAKLIAKDHIRHGKSNTLLYGVRKGMINRCYNSNDHSFKYYGGRGIKICEEWRNDHKLFEIWALKNGYKKGLQIDRKNNNGDYEPGNCKFSTSTENNRNKRNTIMNQESVEKLRQIRQKTNYSQKQIAKMFGISTSLVRDIVNGKLWQIK